MVAYHAGRHGSSIARSIAADLIPATAVEEQLVYPVTTGIAEHPGGYAGAMADFYEESAARLAAHLEAGRDVVLLAEGDPLFYGSYMYMHDRLAGRFETEVVPGVTVGVGRLRRGRRARWCGRPTCSPCCPGRCRSPSSRAGSRTPRAR